MRFLGSLSLIVLALGTLTCSNLPAVEPPAPIVQPAPVAVAHLAVHVFQTASPALTPEDDWEYRHMPGYTHELRRLFQSQLQQAGFTVILDRATPADIVATIRSDMPYEKPGVATLVISRRGEIVDRISVPIRVSGEPPKTVHHAAEAAVRLVEALSRSANVTIVANEVGSSRPAVAASTGLAVAGAACPPVEEALSIEPQPPLAECKIERALHCQAPSPVRSAWQPAPFVQCPPEIPSFVSDVLKQPGRFSALETRNRRLAGACGVTPASGECCYVQFNANVCR